MIQEAIFSVVMGKDLTQKEMKEVFREIMSGKATEAQMAAFLTALRIKKETPEEIAAAASVMRENMVKINATTGVVVDREEINADMETILDTCGTGGSGTNTFNISTATAFVVAGAGVKVAKHGNRSASSRCGSADVLEALGVNITLPPQDAARAIKEIGICFMYAPTFHPAMKNVAKVRREIGIRTIFNILGPLASPASANAQIMGVYEASLVEVIANVLRLLKSRRAFVVHGLDTLDEISITGPTLVGELKNGRVKSYLIRPEDFGFSPASPSAIEGGDAQTNARIVLEVLKGEKSPRRDVVLMNAAAALVVAEKCRSLKEGVKLAEESIDSGKALAKLEALKNFK